MSLNVPTVESGVVNVKFPDGTSDGKVTITVPKGVSWEYSGDVNNLGNIEGRAGGTIAYGTTDMGDGYHVYNVNTNVTEFAVTNIKLRQFHRYAGRTLSGPGSEIKVEVYYNGAVQDTAYIDAIDLTSLGTVGSNIAFARDLAASVDGSIMQSKTDAPGVNITYYETSGVQGAGDGVIGALLDKIQVKVTPISLVGTGDMTKGVMTNLDPANWTMTGPDASGAYTFERTSLTSTGMWYDATTTPHFTLEFPDLFFDTNDLITYTISSNITYMDNLPGSSIPDQNFTVKLVDKIVSLTVNQDQLRHAIENGLNSQNLTRDAFFGNEEGSNGYLGTYYIGNRGGLDSDPTIVSFNFDSTDIGVRSVRAAWPYKDDGSGNNLVTLTNVKYTTTANPSPQTYSGTVTDLGDNSAYITWDMLGLADGEYITSLEYELSTIPALSVASREIDKGSGYICLYGLSYYGDIINLGQSPVSTISLKDKALGTVVQTADLVTNTGNTKGAAALQEINNLVGASGETLSASLKIGSWTSYGSTAHPIFYIRNISDAEIDLDSIVLLGNDGNPIPSSELTITKYTDPSDPAAKEIVKIDTANVQNGKAVVNSQHVDSAVPSDYYRTSELKLSWDYYVPTYATTGTYLWKDMLFVEDPTSGHTLSSADGILWGTGDPYNLNPSTAGYVVGFDSAYSTYLHINGRTDMVIDNAIKYTTDPDSEYTTYSQDGAHLILDAPTTVDVRMSLINNTGVSGVVKAGTTVYMPIPKKGEDWGSLMDPTHQAFEFSTELTGAVTNPDPSTYTVLYGNVTATDSFPTLESYTFEPFNAANAATYNCIKVVQVANKVYDASTPPAGQSSVDLNTDNFVMTLKLSYSDTTNDAEFDIWSPAYHELYTANGGDYGSIEHGEYAALTTQLGQIMGSIWLDEDIDGVQGGAETNLPAADKSGWKVTLYELADYQANGPGATPVSMGNSSFTNPQTTPATGEYFFERLDRSLDYVIVVDNPDVSKYGFTVVGGSTNAYQNNTFVGSTNQSQGVSGASVAPAKATRMVKKTAAGEVNEAKNGIYPFGVRSSIAKAAVTPESASGAVGIIGSTITYTIYYLNTETVPATITVDDAVPTHTSYVSATGSPTVEPAVDDPAGSAIQWSIPNVAPGASGSVTFTVKVLPTALNVNITNTASVTVGSNSPVVTNTVTTKVGGVTAASPSITKTMSATSAPTVTNETFNFTLTSDASNPVNGVLGLGATASKVGTGSVANAFGSTVTFVKAGTYKFVIAETAGSAAGYGYDASTYTWEVVVVDTAGVLSITSNTLKKGGTGNDISPQVATFENTYAVTATPAVASPSITKAFTASSAPRPSNETFNFTLTADAGNPANGTTGLTSTGSVVGSGTSAALFGSAVTFTKAGTYKFTLAEVQGTASGYGYDTATYVWEVVVTDTNSVLSITSNTLKKTGVGVDISPQEAVFTNTYATASDTYAVPSVTKTISGASPSTAETFTFTIAGALGTEPMPATTSITTSGAGVASFGNITYTAAGVYTYTITEVAGSNPGYTYSADSYTLEVTVTDTGAQLNALGVVTLSGQPASSIVFDNVYAQTPIDPSFDIEKRITGDAPSSTETFSFLFSAVSSGAPMPTNATGNEVVRSVAGAGKVNSGSITFTSPGTYVYEVAEISGGVTGWTYDKTVYTVTIVVSDDGQGGLSEVITIQDQNATTATDIVFTNTFTKKVDPKDPDKPTTGTPGDPGSKDPITKFFSRTGDGASIMLPIAVALIALAVLALSFFRRRTTATAGRVPHRRR